jgi:hypothetical protein
LVAITAFPDEVQRDMFNCSLLKPFKVEELKKIVESFENKECGKYQSINHGAKANYL